MTEMPPVLDAILSAPLTPQEAFTWPRPAWEKAFAQDPAELAFLGTVPPRLDRATVTGIVTSEVAAGRWTNAFIVVMVWGYGHAPYGPSRTRTCLTGHKPSSGHPLDPTVAPKLAESARLVLTVGPVEAFRYLNNKPGSIKHLGPAFFTKWLHFVSAPAIDPAQGVAPIYDAIVRRWLSRNAGIDLKRASTDDYARYIDTLSEWGSGHGLVPVDVEEAIFQLHRHGAPANV